MARATNPETTSEEPAGEGHNQPPEEVFLHYVSVISLADKKLAEARDARKVVRKQAKAAGIELGHLDAVVKMAEWDRTEVRAFFATRLQYAEWYALPVDYQPDMFADPAEAEPLGADHWVSKGFQAGVTGAVGTPPNECPGEHMQDWQHGWGKGQAKIAEGLKAAA